MGTTLEVLEKSRKTYRILFVEHKVKEQFGRLWKKWEIDTEMDHRKK
jgi:hypothetical protein